MFATKKAILESGCGYGGTPVKTGTAAYRSATIALPPFVTGPVSRAVSGALATTESEFIELFFVSSFFLATCTVCALAEAAWPPAIDGSFVFF
jgi:hypothetical protein